MTSNPPDAPLVAVPADGNLPFLLQAPQRLRELPGLRLHGALLLQPPHDLRIPDRPTAPGHLVQQTHNSRLQIPFPPPLADADATEQVHIDASCDGVRSGLLDGGPDESHGLLDVVDGDLL